MVITRYTLCDLLDKLDQLLPPAGEEMPGRRRTSRR